MNAESVQRQGQQSRFVKLQGLMVLGVVIVLMAAAYLMYETGIGVPTSTVNHGELLTPAHSIKPLELVDDNSGEVLNLFKGKKKWRILIPGRASCNQACQQTLYLTRQVTIRLAEKSQRVERIYLNFDVGLDSELEGLLATEYPGVKKLRVSFEQWKQWIKPTNGPADPVASNTFFVVDQEGFVMMFYTPKHSGNEVLSDLKRLLKYSYEG